MRIGRAKERSPAQRRKLDNGWLASLAALLARHELGEFGNEVVGLFRYQTSAAVSLA
jgi:hypothetical protein